MEKEKEDLEDKQKMLEAQQNEKVEQHGNELANFKKQALADKAIQQ